MIEIDISVSDPSWEENCPDCQIITETAINAVFKTSPVGKEIIAHGVIPEISIVLANDDLVQTLNHEYRDKDKPTNILSFAQLDTDEGWQAPDRPGPCTLGDLILAYETIAREAQEAGKPFPHHLTHLIMHGTLHLLGYDHIDDEDAEEMESLEIQMLKAMNIENPY